MLAAEIPSPLQAAGWGVIEGSCIRNKGKVPKNASVFFTIFQAFMSGQLMNGRPSPYLGEYPPDFFDFIVIDECHCERSEAISQPWEGDGFVAALLAMT